MATAHQQEILAGATKRLQQLYDDSPQGMYLYLDDDLKSCNKAFAQLLGYKSPAEWAAVVEDIPRAFVADESVETAIRTFQDAVGRGVAQEVPITWKKKGGKSTVKSRTVFVPFDHDGHRIALHFVQPV